MVLRGLKIMLGSVMIAGVLYAFLAMPGFLTDDASTMPSGGGMVLAHP